MEEEYFISVFNEGYPFERYIFKEPVKINALFDDLFLTELFILLRKLNLYWTQQET